MNADRPTLDSVGEQIHTFDEFLLNERRDLGLPCNTKQAEVAGSGLAISGGGMRSASFGLGVIQYFLENQQSAGTQEAAESCFDRFDYLSTVSTGGFVGGAATWLKYHFGGDSAYRWHLGATTSRPRETGTPAGHTTGPIGSFSWIEFFIAHVEYITPSYMSTMSLIGVALRGTFITLFTYTAILTGVLWAMQIAGILPSAGHAVAWIDHPQRIESWLLFLLLTITGAFLLFGLFSWLGSIPTRAALFIAAIPPVWFVLTAVVILRNPDGSPSLNPDGLYWRWPLVLALLLVTASLLTILWWAREDYNQARSGLQVIHKWQYRMRGAYENVVGRLLIALILLGAIWTVPYSYLVVGSTISAFSAGISSSVLGVAAAIYKFIVGSDKKTSSSVVSLLRILLIAALLLYGILLIAYSVVQALDAKTVTIAPNVSFSALAVVGIAGVLYGFYVNANFIGISRMYRDRVMELFMPDVDAIRANQWKRAGVADQFDMAKLVDSEGAPQRPLHLVNCNVNMVDARRDRLRDRGGDSFVLSPRFCGSSTTGWVSASQFTSGHFTLATAIAASAGAGSPQASVAGRGIARNPLVSLVLTLINVRLGYWVRNPLLQRTVRNWHKWFPPNLLSPGIRQGLFGSGHSETAFFIELTDGGHFDNTGLYELIRRRVQIVVLSHASGAPANALKELGEVIRRVREDFGVHVELGSDEMPLDQGSFAETGSEVPRGWAFGTIQYPFTDSVGILVYLHAATRPRSKGVPSTATEPFDEVQLNAYRQLGMTVARTAIEKLRGHPGLSDESMAIAKRTFGWRP